MAHAGKRYAKAAEVAKQAVGSDDGLELAKAIEVAKANATAKFDETMDMAVRLGVDPKHADQMVRGTVVLPHGTGKKVRVLVFAKGEKEKEAQDAGADHVGAEDMVEKIQGGWLEFDRAIATPDVMGLVGRLGKVLGPRGMMPNPKVGTVTMDVTAAIKAAKGGAVEFRVEKAGIVQAGVGKASFTEEQIAGNIRAFVDAVMKAKPAASKGTYVKKLSISSSMGPGLKLDLASVTAPPGSA